MTIQFNTQEQQEVDQLRLDMAQVIVDVAQMPVAELTGRHAKERAIENLRSIRIRMDKLGIKHSTLMGAK